MKRICKTNCAILYFLCGIATFGASPKLTLANGAIGKNLQIYTTVALSEPAAADLVITLTSSDPAKLLLAKLPDAAGSASINVKARAGFRESAEFWLQATSDSGDVTYTATAEGFSAATGTMKLTPSGVLISGPYGTAAAEFVTTPRGWPTKITLRAVRLDASLKSVESQLVRGGLSSKLEITSSDPKVGAVTVPLVSIAPATDIAVAQFKPAAPGATTLAVKSSDFSTPAAMNTLVAKVRVPGIGLVDEMTIGENLQFAGVVNLGEPAPEGGVTITIVSSDPSKLLISGTATAPGSASIQIKIPAGGAKSMYYLQALAGSGSVKHTASAPGYMSRIGTVALAPSGVIISPKTHGPPDEAEVFRPESAGTKQNMFVALLSEHKSTPLTLFTAFLNPTTHRAADITVQPLRAGLSVAVEIQNTDPTAGTISSPVTIEGGVEHTTVPFTPLHVGQTTVSVVTPKRFATPSNSTGLLVIVRE